MSVTSYFIAKFLKMLVEGVGDDPDVVERYRINYLDVYHTPCPCHNCATYRTLLESEYVYCPKCRKPLAVWY